MHGYMKTQHEAEVAHFVTRLLTYAMLREAGKLLISYGLLRVNCSIRLGALTYIFLQEI